MLRVFSKNKKKNLRQKQKTWKQTQTKQDILVKSLFPTKMVKYEAVTAYTLDFSKYTDNQLKAHAYFHCMG